MSKFGQKNSR